MAPASAGCGRPLGVLTVVSPSKTRWISLPGQARPAAHGVGQPGAHGVLHQIGRPPQQGQEPGVLVGDRADHHERQGGPPAPVLGTRYEAAPDLK